VIKHDSIQENGAIVSRSFKGGMITLRVDAESANLTMIYHDDDDDDDDDHDDDDDDDDDDVI